MNTNIAGKRRRDQSAPVEAWAGSCEAALLIPFFTGLFISLIGWLVGSEELVLLAVVGFFGLFVHFGAYLVLGLPAFCLLWRCHDCGIWNGFQGHLLGGMLGGLSVCLVIPDLFALVGVFYGVVTSFAAQRARRKVLAKC